mmetsp:Transcript_24936/g.62493  ORF Transcript_24936/g.62493 Transcript_24936/m.62493 type:complete len:208 (+) Transcript_24936:625-1248(+)
MGDEGSEVRQQRLGVLDGPALDEARQAGADRPLAGEVPGALDASAGLAEFCRHNVLHYGFSDNHAVCLRRHGDRVNYQQCSCRYGRRVQVNRGSELQLTLGGYADLGAICLPRLDQHHLSAIDPEGTILVDLLCRCHPRRPNCADEFSHGHCCEQRVRPSRRRQRSSEVPRRGEKSEARQAVEEHIPALGHRQLWAAFSRGAFENRV